MTATKTVRSVCPYDCPDTCSMLVEIASDKVLKVSGDPDHPFTRGFLCGKMQNYELTVHSERRLLTPLKSIGAKGSGRFAPISWKEAITLISDNWKKIIDSYGAEAILPYSYAGTMGLIQRNSGHPFFHKLGASRLERAICSPAKNAGWKAVMGDTPSVDPDEVAKSDLVILWGINAIATSVHFMYGVNEAKKRGATVWLIDTYLTPTASAVDRVFLVRPGSDGALALGIMHILLRDDLLDKEFINTSVQGFEQFAATILPQYTPEFVSSITGINSTVIEDIATQYGRAAAPFIRLGSGLSRYGNGAMTVRTIACLPALIGAYGKDGGGCFPDTSTGAAFAMHEITREDFMTKPTRLVNMNRLGDALNNMESPPIKSLYVYHSNPAAVTPDQNAVIKGLLREDLFTVVHERFMTDTARYADILLPATSSLEHADVYRSYGTYMIQKAAAAIPPVGESRSNWEVFSLLAESMGFNEPFFRQSINELIAHLLSIPSPLRSGIDLDRFHDGKAVRLNMISDKKRFVTPSGRIEIYNPSTREPFPRYLPTHQVSEKGKLSLMTAPSLHSLNASFYEREDLRKKQQRMTLLMNGFDADQRCLKDGDVVTVWNEHGEVLFWLEISEKVPVGVVVAEGVWWTEFAPGKRTVNALVSQRLTDEGGGSTFYDNSVEVTKGRQEIGDHDLRKG